MDGGEVAAYANIGPKIEGRGREVQQDRLVVASRRIGEYNVTLMCAIDGIGGGYKGEGAAEIFAQALNNSFIGFNLDNDKLKELDAWFRDNKGKQEANFIFPPKVFEDMMTAVEDLAQQELEQKEKTDPRYSRSGCVYNAAFVISNAKNTQEAYVCYFYRGDALGMLLSHDRNHQVTNPQEHPSDGRVTNYFPRPGLQGITQVSRALEPGDIVMVVTDGISDNLGFNRPLNGKQGMKLKKLLAEKVRKIGTQGTGWSALFRRLRNLWGGSLQEPSARSFAENILKEVERGDKIDNQAMAILFYK